MRRGPSIFRLVGDRPGILDPEGPGSPAVRGLLALEADRLLAPLGFRQLKPLRWFRDRGVIRDVFRFYSLKWYGIAPAWGFDLAIAPLLVGQVPRPKSSLGDLFGDLVIDPLDLPGPHQVLKARRLFGTGLAVTRVTGFAARSVAAATATFDRARSIADVRTIYEERSRMVYERFGPSFNIQNDLGWALTCFATGDDREGRQLLDGFRAKYDVSPDDPVLVEAIAAARAESVAAGPARSAWAAGALPDASSRRS